MNEPLVGSKSGISKDEINRIRGGQDFDKSGQLGKWGPSARAKADAAAASQTTASGILYAQSFIPEQNFLGRQSKKPLTCRAKVKISDDQFQPKDDGNNNN